MRKIELHSSPISLGTVNLTLLLTKIRFEGRVGRYAQGTGQGRVDLCRSCAFGTWFSVFTCPQKRKRPLPFLPDGPRDGKDTYTRSPSCILGIQLRTERKP